MSYLLNETMKIVKDWPNSFKVDAYDFGAKRLDKMKAQKFFSSDHITPTEKDKVPDPYKFTKNREQALLLSRQKRA